MQGNLTSIGDVTKSISSNKEKSEVLILLGRLTWSLSVCDMEFLGLPQIFLTKRNTEQQKTFEIGQTDPLAVYTVFQLKNFPFQTHRCVQTRVISEILVTNSKLLYSFNQKYYP